MVIDPPGRGKRRRFLLWVSPVDGQNGPVDPVFLRAADEIGRRFFLYRTQDLNDECLVAELAERAVHKASRAKKGQPVEDAVGYLFRTFTRLVDVEIEKLRRLRPLAERAADRVEEAYEHHVEIEHELEWKEIVQLLDEEEQRLMEWLHWDFPCGRLGTTAQASTEHRRQADQPLPRGSAGNA